MSFTNQSSIRRMSAAGAALVLATLATMPAASASSKGGHGQRGHRSTTCKSANGVRVTGPSASEVCSGLRAYRGQTVTFVAPDKPGGGFDQFARLYAPYLSEYLGATINVTNIPAGNTVAGQNFVAATNANHPGMTIGWLNAGPDIEDQLLGLSGIQFNPKGEVFLGSTPPSLSMTAAFNSPACSAWDHGFASLLKNNSASNAVHELIQSTGSTTFSMLLIDGVFGIHYVATKGYASSADLVSGWVRGDGCVITDPVSVLGGYVAAGKATPLLLNATISKNIDYYSSLKNVPTYAQAEKRFGKYIKSRTQKVAADVLLQDAETSRVLFVPPSTPKNLQAALRYAFRWASYNHGLEQKAATLGALPGYQSPKAAKTGYVKFDTGAQKVTEYLAAIR